jgi:hypothetical protein
MFAELKYKLSCYYLMGKTLGVKLHVPLLPFADAAVPKVVTCAFESQKRFYLTLT